jgi:RHH-type proline utilization regulon transcriptional repressor/proline dehydrogenase/delta 1-pyrroline-5-carboxylate dehydrogenase
MTAVPEPNPTATTISDEMGVEVVETVERWLGAAVGIAASASATWLADMLRERDGLGFTVGFIDGVIRPEDTRVAARNFARLARTVPGFLPWFFRIGIRLGALAGLIVPPIVIPIVRRVLRGLVSHLVLDASDAPLRKSIAAIRARGARPNINLLGEAVLGRHEADRRLEGTRKLLARPDVDYVSIKVSSTVPPHSPWSFAETVDEVVDRLVPLYRLAANSSPAKFVNLDMEEYRDLDMTIAVFTRILDQPEFTGLEAGIVLQAYLPDALDAMIRLQDWAAGRRARGGASVKVRLVKGANLPMERVESSLRGWPLATWNSKQESDTNYKRVLDYALHADRAANIRLGVAGHNLFDIAFAWHLATQRGVADRVEFEMLLGMAESQAEVVRRDVGRLLLYTPVVHAREFDVAIAYLIRRLEEGASQDNFMSAVFELHRNRPLFEREKKRFLASLAEVDDAVPPPHRVQDRSLPPAALPASFENVADTDSAVAANRVWGEGILARVPGSRLGLDLIGAHMLHTPEEMDASIERAVTAARAWGARSGAERAGVLRAAALELERRRADLIEVMASECGKTIDQADPEVSEAIDFANYYAGLAEELETIDGAEYRPVALTVVTPPWNFPVAIPAGSMLAPLAAGSAVLAKPASLARRSGSLVVEALWAAGVPTDVLQLTHLADNKLGTRLLSDPRVDRVILTGSYETAEMFRSFRRDLPLFAETSGKNAIIVTPSADIDLAVKDVVASAFGHAGQKCSAASLVILVGSVGRSARFRNQLIDEVTSLHVGFPSDPRTQMGPLTEVPKGKLASVLTTLHPGERWLVEPRRLGDDPRLWSPGVKDGVRRGSEFHLVEYFGPVLGIITARTLAEAIEIQNEVDYGLTAGLHSLDDAEVGLWVDAVQAGNVYVNRGTTGAIVRRQPFGGWKKSGVGPGTKAGGPNHLLALVDWTPAHSTSTAPIGAIDDRFLGLARTAELDAGAQAFLRRSIASDADAWASEYGIARDVSDLGFERNVLRYRPFGATVRLAEDGSVAELLRVAAAAARAGARASISIPEASRPLRDGLAAAGFSVVVETDRVWRMRAAHIAGTRVRLVGGDPLDLAEATDGRADIAIYSQPVTESGRIEMLPFLREQAVSICAQRYGSLTSLASLPLGKGDGRAA